MSRWLALGAGIVLLSAVPRTLDAPLTATPRIAVIMPPEPGTWLLGVRLGAEEARLTSELLRRHVQIVEVTSEPDAATVVAREAAAGTAVLVVGVGGAAWQALEEAVAAYDLVLVDTRPSFPASASCPAGVFRVGLPDDPAAGHSRHELWHESLERSGARQLNERFRRRFGQGMDGAAWAGWLGVKIAVEALLRVERAEPSSVTAYLGSPAAAFDGHKGQPLRFDSASRLLVQPVYEIQESGSVVEAGPAPSPTCSPERRQGS